jgi:glycosyltransferase involved in cell wall biosynthesis
MDYVGRSITIRGTPVVATRTSSIPELVGGMAPLVDRLSPDVLAAALAKSLTNPHASNPLTLLQLAKSFTWSKCLIETVGVYTALDQSVPSISHD